MISDSDIIELVKTKSDAMLLQKQCAAAIDALFSNKTIDAILNDCFAYDKKEKLLFLMQQQHITVQDTSQIQAFLQHIVSRLQELPVITVTLAFAPKQPMVTSLSAWFGVHTKKAVLLDILVDARLIGGAIITYNGIYKDYSVKKILEEKYSIGYHK